MTTRILTIYLPEAVIEMIKKLVDMKIFLNVREAIRFFVLEGLLQFYARSIWIKADGRNDNSRGFTKILGLRVPKAVLQILNELKIFPSQSEAARHLMLLGLRQILTEDSFLKMMEEIKRDAMEFLRTTRAPQLAVYAKRFIKEG